MLDDNWETINGPVAHQIEVLNATNQINALEALILFLLAHRGENTNVRAPMPDEPSLCHLHHAGTLFLLADPGIYRNMDVHTQENGVVIYRPPTWQSVEGLMKAFFRTLSMIWTSGDALDAAAYALWRINWIHPFRNGNGRTARSFSYACLSLHLGAVLPGAPTVIDLMGTEMTAKERKMSDDDYIPVNLPFPKGRLPVCACDMKDEPPTKQQRMECRMRGGPCSPGYDKPCEPS